MRFPDITLPESLDEVSYVAWAIGRQMKLASDFREFLTAGQKFNNVNANRQKFYGKVVKAAKRVVSIYFVVFVVILTYLLVC
jgi:hypothetical protein